MSYKSPRKGPYNDYQLNPNNNSSSRMTSPNLQQSMPYDNLHYANQSPKNKYEYGMFSKRYLPKEKNNTSRSKVSNNTTYLNSGMIPEEKLYSEQILFLLSEEENNLKYFKDKIESQKQRVERDFNNFKKQIQHYIEDLRISFLAELDVVYKDFMNKYLEFKRHMIQLREMRKHLMNQIPPDQNDYLNQLNQSKNTLSNRDLLNQIEKDSKLFHHQRVYNQITELQKEMIGPGKDLALQIVALGAIQAQYYNEAETMDLFKRLTELFQNQLKGVYPEIKNNFVRTTTQILAEVLQNKNQTTNILNGLSQYESQDDFQREKQQNVKNQDHREPIKSQYLGGNMRKNPYDEDIYGNDKQDDRKKGNNRPVSSSTDFLQIGTTSKQPAKQVTYKQQLGDEERKRPTSMGHKNYQMGLAKKQERKIKKINVSAEQQNVYSEWIEEVNFRQCGVIECHQFTDAILCGIFANNGKNIVVGGKDKILRVYEVNNGKLLYNLSGHAASICSLADHGSFISSGGDHGCSSLILWDCRSWNIKCRMQLHTAAVTCIVDLYDGFHLATGSYDKKINIFNHKKGVIAFSLNVNKSPVACMAVSGDRNRLISSGLDNSITIWKIYKEGQMTTDIAVERQLMNGSLVCTLRAFSLKSIFFVAGTKEGKLQIINMITGQTIKKLTVGSASIIQLILFERQNKTENPLVLSCSAKQKSMMLTKTETGINSIVDVKGRLNVDYGCGIGPKIIVNGSGLMAIVSQSTNAKEIMLYQIGVF